MSSTTPTTGSATTKFYSPAASTAAAGGRIERFVTALYQSHRQHTQRLE